MPRMPAGNDKFGPSLIRVLGARVVAALGLACLLAACSGKDAASAEPAGSANSGTMTVSDLAEYIAPEGRLRVVTLPGNIGDWVPQFENSTGCKVEIRTVETEDELVRILASGGPPPSPPGDASWPPPGNAPYDLVIATANIAPGLIAEGRVQAIGLDRLPRYVRLDPDQQGAPWHFVDGTHYGVPWLGRPNLAAMLAAGAPHPNCAYKWLEHSLTL